jgi:transcriptional regulator ATRX
LQNNLVEYWCMVSFVKPNLLGTSKEFKNRFVNPILNGQHADSTDGDVQFMKKRAHILHTTLEGCVQRKDYEVIKPLLPAKHEFAIFVRLSSKQCDLYRTYLEREGYAQPANIGKIKGAQLFQDFYNLSRICTHPWTLRIHSEIEIAKSFNRMEGFVDDDSDHSTYADSDHEVIEIQDDMTNDGHVSDSSVESIGTKKRKF